MFASQGTSYQMMTEAAAGTPRDLMRDQAEQSKPKQLLLETWHSETDYGDSSGVRRSHQTLTGPKGKVVLAGEDSSRAISPRMRSVLTPSPSTDFVRTQLVSGQAEGTVERVPSERYQRSLRSDRTEVQILASSSGLIQESLQERVREVPVQLVTSPLEQETHGDNFFSARGLAAANSSASMYRE
ncbi:hypothetical protein Ciccas_013086 [Cichlidogyrus casuarinus]|uniref:Uncharacterized protein n=1 Tax=Cichlidogyrus casuarinus TaxID=1844966 RepID=A0ABD2PLM0_9PLAT